MMAEMRKLEGVYAVNFDFCMLGMKSIDRDGVEGPAKKRTKVLTNCGHIAAALVKAQRSGQQKHVVLDSGRPKACEEYPEKFCEATVTGLKREFEDESWINKLYQGGRRCRTHRHPHVHGRGSRDAP